MTLEADVRPVEDGSHDATLTSQTASKSRSSLMGALRRLRPSSKVLYGGLTLVLTIILWWIASVMIDARMIMPAPVVITETIYSNFTSTDPLGATGWDHLLLTLRRIVLGFLISMLAGTAIGLLMGRLRVLEDSLTPLVTVGLSMPAIAWTLLAILWFGLTEFMGQFTLAVVVTPFVIVSIWEGTKAVDKDLVEMASVFNASRRQRIRRIYVPHLSPYLFAAVRYAFAICWKIILIVEIFGLPGGVGTILNFWYQQVNIAQVFAWTMTFGIVIIVVEGLIIAPARRRVFRWKPDDLEQIAQQVT